MKNSNNKHRTNRRKLHLQRLKAQVRKKGRHCSNRPYRTLTALMPVEVKIVEIDPLLLEQVIASDPWYNTLLEAGFAEVRFVDTLPAKVMFNRGSYELLKALSRVHAKILLGKWLRYAQFYNLAWFQFREIGKPSQGVSPPRESTLQAA